MYKNLFKIILIFLSIQFIRPNLCMSTTHVWIAIGPPSIDPEPGSFFTTRVGISAWNGTPAAIDLIISHNPDIIKMVNIIIPDISPFYQNSFIDSSNNHSGQTQIACFQVANVERWDTLSTIGIIEWEMVSHSDLAIDINLEILSVVESKWNPVDVHSYGQHIGKIETGIDNQNWIPLKYDLSNNYPNPFNPNTNIDYQLPKDSFVTIKIYNVLGQLVKTLIDKKQPPGYYSIQWPGRDEFGEAVASGVYFYQIRAGSFIKSKSMVLVR